MTVVLLYMIGVVGSALYLGRSKPTSGVASFLWAGAFWPIFLPWAIRGEIFMWWWYRQLEKDLTVECPTCEAEVDMFCTDETDEELLVAWPVLVASHHDRCALARGKKPQR